MVDSIQMRLYSLAEVLYLSMTNLRRLFCDRNAVGIPISPLLFWFWIRRQQVDSIELFI